MQWRYAFSLNQTKYVKILINVFRSIVLITKLVMWENFSQAVTHPQFGGPFKPFSAVF